MSMFRQQQPTPPGSTIQSSACRRSRSALCNVILSASIAVCAFTFVNAGCQAPPVTEDAQIASLRDPNPAVRRMGAQFLGGHRDPHAVAALIGALKDPNWEVREFAADSLGQIKDQSAVQPLIAVLDDTNGVVSSAAADSLGRIKDPRAVEPLIAAFRRHPGNPLVIKALGELGDHRAITPLIDFMTHAKETYYDGANMENAFRGIGSPAIDPLVTALNDPYLSDPNRRIKARIACALFAIKDPRTVATMVRVIRTQEYGTCAMRGLADSGDPRAIAALIGVMTDPNDPENETASSLLFENGAKAVEPLVAVLQSPDARSRRLAAKALAQIKDPRAVNALLDALRRRDTAAVAGGYVFFVDYGQQGSEDTLIEALNQYNDEQMAEFMLNCGNSKVEAATRAWGNKHDPQLHQEVYGVVWGARKLQSAR